MARVYDAGMATIRGSLCRVGVDIGGNGTEPNRPIGLFSALRGAFLPRLGLRGFLLLVSVPLPDGRTGDRRPDQCSDRQAPHELAHARLFLGEQFREVGQSLDRAARTGHSRTVIA